MPRLGEQGPAVAKSMHSRVYYVMQDHTVHTHGQFSWFTCVIFSPRPRSETRPPGQDHSPPTHAVSLHDNPHCGKLAASQGWRLARAAGICTIKVSTTINDSMFGGLLNTYEAEPWQGSAKQAMPCYVTHQTRKRAPGALHNRPVQHVHMSWAVLSICLDE